MTLMELRVEDLLNMKKEDFDKFLKEDTSNLGEILSVSNYLTYQHTLAMANIDALKKKALTLSDDDRDKQACISAIQNLYGFANKFEYMIVMLKKKADDLNKGVE